MIYLPRASALVAVYVYLYFEAVWRRPNEPIWVFAILYFCTIKTKVYKVPSHPSPVTPPAAWSSIAMPFGPVELNCTYK